MIDNARVEKFLWQQKEQWNKWNIPYEDGQALYDLVLRERAKNILEIGTSFGHSTIWLAWAVAQNGGEVLTMEVDHRVMEAARRNFKIAGVLPYILQCQTEARRMVPKLSGPFDLVFSDGDRSHYIEIFEKVEPLLSSNGIIVTHNVTSHGGPKIEQYLEFLENHPRFETLILNSSPEGLAISRKRV